MALIPLNGNIEECVHNYFHRGYPYKNILQLLDHYHGMKISLRTLHRILRHNNLRRRSVEISSKDIVDFVIREIQAGENRGILEFKFLLIQ